jgi:putative membrane protein insertion efficiency factor
MKTILIFLVRVYQVAFSPVLHALCGPLAGCRFTPTCSQYFIDAVRVHGAIKGAWLGICRICRCQPWGGHGHDPVPGWEDFEKSHPEFAHRHNRGSVGAPPPMDRPDA